VILRRFPVRTAERSLPFRALAHSAGSDMLDARMESQPWNRDFAEDLRKSR